MNSILLVSSSINARHTLIDMIQAIDCRYQFKSVNSGSEARREVENYSYDVIIINYPLADELGDSLACEISNKYSASVILIVKPDILAKDGELIRMYDSRQHFCAVYCCEERKKRF